MELVIKITDRQKKFIDKLVASGECYEMLHPVVIDEVMKEIKDGTPLLDNATENVIEILEENKEKFEIMDKIIEKQGMLIQTQKEVIDTQSKTIEKLKKLCIKGVE